MCFLNIKECKRFVVVTQNKTNSFNKHFIRILSINAYYKDLNLNIVINKNDFCLLAFKLQMKVAQETEIQEVKI